MPHAAREGRRWIVSGELKGRRVYLSGPMTGIAEFNYPAFMAAEAELCRLGYDVVNPAKVKPDGEPTWENYMRADLRDMLTCDAIALMPGWENSKGARMELFVACGVEMKVVFVADLVAGAAERRVTE